MIDQAIAPLQMRLAELERRPRAPSAPAYAVTPPPAVVQAQGAPYASAMAAPAAAPRSLIVAPPPLLDVKAIERDASIAIDLRGFDGGKRKRRMMLLFFLAVLVLFGGLFALLADSYTPQH